MNKAELIDQIAEKAEVTKVAVDRVLSAFSDLIGKSLKGNDSVALASLGTFVVRATAAREGRNPRTGEKIKIKAGKRITFKAAKALKEAVQGK